MAAKGIKKTLGGTAVLRGVDINAPAGSTVSVIGPSGSGKSTLLRVVNRLYEPDSGDILLDGRSVLRDDPDLLRQRIGMLSGGQQQRVAIARALAMTPQVMFFDEATSALDPEMVKGILRLIADLGTAGMTMVVVTHEMAFARSASDTVVFMDHGKIVESGSPETIFEAARTDRLQRFLSQLL